MGVALTTAVTLVAGGAGDVKGCVNEAYDPEKTLRLAFP